MTQGSQGSVPPESQFKPTKQGGELEKINDIETEIDRLIQALGRLQHDLRHLRSSFPRSGGPAT